MAKKNSVNEIIAKALPGMEVVADPSDGRDVAKTPVTSAAAPGTSLEDLRKKYLGVDPVQPATTDSMAALRDKFLGARAKSSDSTTEFEKTPAASDDVEVVQVRAKQGSADPADDPGPRTVIVSKTKGIVGTQG